MRLLVFDNYDSFTYNLVHLAEKILHTKVEVRRNDEIPLEEIKDYNKIILSPGPGIPSEAGLLIPLIREYAATKSILGICLGHQAIAEAFGGRLINLSQVYHGISTAAQLTVEAKNSSLFKDMPSTFEIGRYHSWIVDDNCLPPELLVTARDENGMIMGLQHRQYDIAGVQFHPESVLTPNGEKILANWLKS